MNEPLTWRPGRDAVRRGVAVLAAALLGVGVLAFGLSFDSVRTAAQPVFGRAAWAAPILMDATIGILVGLGLVLELAGLRARLPRLAAHGLVALTVYANVAPAHGIYSRVLHGAPPAVWVLTVAVLEGTVRRLVGLTDEKRIEGVRRSLWILRPVGTWRVWRRMRVEQIPTYRDAMDRDAAHAVVTGRLRLQNGRLWRTRAPLAERIALRLGSHDPAGVAAVLRDHARTAALLAAPGALEPEPGAPDAAPARVWDPALLERARKANAEVVGGSGAPASARALARRLRIGQDTARALVHELRREAEVHSGAPIRQANGSK